jgi:hypothetical protein
MPHALKRFQQKHITRAGSTVDVWSNKPNLASNPKMLAANWKPWRRLTTSQRFEGI